MLNAHRNGGKRPMDKTELNEIDSTCGVSDDERAVIIFARLGR